MSQHNDRQTAELIQSYLRAKWRGDAELGDGAALEESLRDRLDDLGFDGERLIHVAPNRVMPELQRMEREAELEDAAVAKAAIKAQENPKKQADAKPDRSGPANGKRRGQKGKANGRRGRGQRGQR